MSTLTEAGTGTTDAVRDVVERELLALEKARPVAPDLDDLRRRMPRANGDQDTW